MNTAPPIVPLAPTMHNMTVAAELIRSGKLVIVPTETVYGIAVNLASNDARAAARQIKEIPGGQMGSPWVVHVASPEEALGWVPGLGVLPRRLVLKALPGPVAFQIKLSAQDLAQARQRLGGGAAADETLQDGFLTLRCPDFSATQKVLELAGSGTGAIGIVGAGTPAQPAVFEPADVPEALTAAEDGGEAKIAAVIDGGPTRYRKSSTVVRIIGESFSVVRAGVIDERIIQKMADLQILFVCSGNTCRSPMAAALAARVLADRFGISPSELPLRHIVVQSAGLHANRGLRAAREAVEAVGKMNADLGSHISQPATLDLLRRADVIYTMTDAHREEILDIMPSAGAKVQRIDPEEDVEDPIGAGLDVYEDVANRLYELIKQRVSELAI